MHSYKNISRLELKLKHHSYGQYLLPKVLFLVSFFFLHFPSDGKAEKSVLDSLQRPLNRDASAIDQAERLEAILWYVFLDYNLSYDNYPEQLDSLNQCCIAGKPGNENFKQRIAAESALFRGAKILYDHPEKAKSLFETAVPLFEDTDDSASLAIAHMFLCQVAGAMGDSLAFARAYEISMQGIHLISNPEMLSMVYNNLGISCYDFGRYAEATELYFRILELTDKHPTPLMVEGKASTYSNIAGVYLRLSDYPNAMLYTQKALETAAETKEDASDFLSMSGTILIREGKYLQASEALQSIFKYQPEPNTPNTIAATTYKLATCYRMIGDLNRAVPLAQKAIALLPLELDAYYGASALVEMANCELELKQIALALQHGLKAYKTFLEARNNTGIVDAAQLLSRAYASSGDFQKAFEFSQIRLKHQQLIERQQSTRQLAFGEFTRDNAAKQARREAEVKAELDRQRNIRYALLAGLGVFAVMAFLLYNRYRFKQRTALQLEAKNTEVEAARRRAEQSEAFKSRFLANMSHEIRTPLHGISGFADLLQDTSLTEKQRRWLNAIHQSSGRLRDVVNDILDLSKLEAGEVTLRQVPFSPLRVAQEVTESLKPKVDEKGIRIVIESNPNIPPAVLGDPTRLYQILTNLAGNAVKFTEKGKVTIAMELLNEGQPETASIRFAIQDTGIGIPPERIEAVFESFQQAEDSTTAKFGGTGLGLTIARDLVRLYGSDIVVRSQVGIGSEFSFTLLLPIADVSDLEEHAQTTTGYYDQPICVLVVDDNAFNREISEEALHKHFEHVEVTFAVNGIEAVEKAGQHTFDIILMDMQMPEMNGLEATQHIRQLPGEKGQVPIVALTASATPEEIQSALDAGMDRHLGKPFKPVELASVIATVLKLEPTSDNITNPQQDQLEVDDHRDGSKYDLTFLRDFCDGDEEQMKYFLDKFHQQLPIEMERMEQALQQGDFERIYQVAHSFRPQLEFVGLKVAAAKMLSIEKEARTNQNLDLLISMYSEIKDKHLS